MKTELERYAFDVSGFLIIKNHLTSAVVDELNTIVDNSHGNTKPSKFPLLGLHERFLDLMTDPKIMEICKYCLDDWFRLDHIYGLQAYSSQDVVPNLHGGPKANQGAFQYNWFNGRSVCGLLVFGIMMEDQNSGDGGLVFIPGSHKQNMAIEGNYIYNNLLGANWQEHPLVVNPTLKKGDLVVFTEALVHGSTTWKPTRRRRVLYYKYSPGYLAWRDYREMEPYYNLARNNKEKLLLRPPFVAGYDERGNSNGINNWRSKTV